MIEKLTIDFLRNNGPSIPVKIAKYIGKDLLLTSALLGEMAINGKIKASFLKIGGGSPLYYLPGQEAMLANFYEHLGNKEKQAFLLIKEKKVLRENTLSPIVRVSLRALKDFAIPLNVKMKDKTEIFWKWYLLTDKEAEEYIRSILESDIEDNIEEEKKEIIDKKSEDKKQEPVKETKEEQISEKISEKNYSIKEQPQKEIKSEIQQKSRLDIEKKSDKKSEEQKGKTEETKDKIKTIQEVNQKETNQRKVDEIKNEISLNSEFSAKYPSAFGKKLIKYFEEKKISIKTYEQIKKNKEYSMILAVPSAIGISKFYCKAIDKKKILDADIALALIEAQYRSLPCLIIGTSEIPSKLYDKMNSLFKDVNYIKI